MQLGLVTYNLAPDWDLETLLSRCEETGLAAVELRTTHAHGVEPSLDAAARRAVRRRFEQTPVRLLSLGTTCEFHSTDAATLRAQIASCAEWCRLAAEVGALGVKVRPNGLPAERSVKATLAQIAAALEECAAVAAPLGVQLWLEVHGPGTSEPRHVRTILDLSGAPPETLRVCWNSNQTDRAADGSIDAAFALLSPRLGNVHINELYRRDYPWRDLFRLLRGIGYRGYCLAELGSTSTDPVTVLRYYRALFQALGGGEE